ncbi:hypothetical protein B0J11DRAFT_595126 [Dendryphion nanum]|uniref:Uncharacterized protein n=1 Tax=Dendryphion nanum TaxID=256645 RepID=A0A9P9D7C8_9PLEO|nr:hypothetical protein B0J11DRAFT_595126 [Dendryphion nanum]
MKLFSTGLFLLAGPLLAEASCLFTFHQTANWYDNGLWRYRVHAVASGNEPDTNTHQMMHDFCNVYYAKASWFSVNNAQCHRNGGVADADSSVFQGRGGTDAHHSVYVSIVAQLQNDGYNHCEFVNHAAY